MWQHVIKEQVAWISDVWTGSNIYVSVSPSTIHQEHNQKSSFWCGNLPFSSVSSDRNEMDTMYPPLHSMRAAGSYPWTPLPATSFCFMKMLPQPHSMKGAFRSGKYVFVTWRLKTLKINIYVSELWHEIREPIIDVSGLEQSKNPSSVQDSWSQLSETVIRGVKSMQRNHHHHIVRALLSVCETICLVSELWYQYSETIVLESELWYQCSETIITLSELSYQCSEWNNHHSIRAATSGLWNNNHSVNSVVLE